MLDVGLGSQNAETRDRTGDLQIFSLTPSQLSYRGTGFLRVASAELCFGGLAAVGLAMRGPSEANRILQSLHPRYMTLHARYILVTVWLKLSRLGFSAILLHDRVPFWCQASVRMNATLSSAFTTHADPVCNSCS